MSTHTASDSAPAAISQAPRDWEIDEVGRGVELVVLLWGWVEAGLPQ